MSRMVSLVGDDVLIEFHDALGAYGRAQTASLAEELVYFDSCHSFLSSIRMKNEHATG